MVLDSQIAQGLTYLVSTSATGDNGWLYSTVAPIAERRSGGFIIRATFRAALHPASVPFEQNRSGVAQWRSLHVGTDFRALPWPATRICP